MIDTDELKKDLQELERKRRERDLNDVRKVLLSPEGRRLIWRLMSYARIFKPSYTGNSETFFNEGRRDVGLLILEEVMAAKPDSFTQMQKESTTDALQVKPQRGHS